jgi:hypothetical protein
VSQTQTPVTEIRRIRTKRQLYFDRFIEIGSIINDAQNLAQTRCLYANDGIGMRIEMLIAIKNMHSDGLCLQQFRLTSEMAFDNEGKKFFDAIRTLKLGLCEKMLQREANLVRLRLPISG